MKRLRFDARDALDSLVIFGMLWVVLGAILLIVMPLVRSIRAGSAPDAAPAQRIGTLALPFLTLLALLVGRVEPALGPLELLLNNPDPDQPNVAGTLIVLGAFALAVAGCLVARAPLVRTLRAGGSLLAHPVNLALAALVVLFLAIFVVGLAVDQYPCWSGVPNCD